MPAIRIATLAVLALVIGSCTAFTGLDADAFGVTYFRDATRDTLIVADRDGGGDEQRIRLPVLGFTRVSPRGDRLAVVLNSGIWVMDFDGGDSVQVGPRASNLTWSPDGARLAYIPISAKELHLVSTRGGGDVVVPGAVPDAYNLLAWSPDGRRIAYDGMNENTRTIYVVNLDGSGRRDIESHLPGPEMRASGEPTWSPDGREIAYSRRLYHYLTGWQTKLWVYSLVTGKARQITFASDAEDVRPSWSPDGTQIAFLRFQGYTSDVYVVSPYGTRLTPITETPNNTEEYPLWLLRRD